MAQTSTHADTIRMSNKIRQQWANAIAAGTRTFREAVVLSTRKDAPEKALSSLRLVLILSSRPGWSEATALEALVKSGFSAKDNIQSIRRSEKKIELFSLILRTTHDRWRARPTPPQGWPWRGKLSLLVQAAGAPMPDELVATLSAHEAVDPAPVIHNNEADTTPPRAESQSPEVPLPSPAPENTDFAALLYADDDDVSSETDDDVDKYLDEYLS